MAERVIKYQTQDGEQLLDPQIQGTDGKSSDEIRDTVNALRNGGASGAEAIDVARKTKIAEGDMNPGDGRNVAMDVAKCLRDALREHGDEMKAVFLSNSTNEGVTIKVQYMPDEQGQADEDEFVFRWPDGVLKLDNVAHPVELCQLQKQSGTVAVQKDLVKANLLKFLQSHDNVDSEDAAQPADPNALPDGPVAEEQLWESDECQQAFCDAVDMYRKAKSKDSIKALFRAARPYQKGNTIQEKLKGAVDWYNIYKENPPKNTKDQVFLEDSDLEEGYVPGVITALQKISEGLNILKEYINHTQDTWFGSYYRELSTSFERMTEFVKRRFASEEDLKEFMDLNDPIANGEPDNYGGYGRDNDEFNKWNEDYDDEPVVGEGDEFGPEVGDTVDYEGGHYKLYGYCGYEVVLQNVDDERDFKIVKPEEAGFKSPEKDLKETNWVDPDDLPDDNNELQGV